MRAGVIVVAAGRSTRLRGPVPKPYLRIGRRTLLAHVLAAFQASPDVAEVVVVAAGEHLQRARRVAAPFSKVHAVVPGGARRQDSVAAGLAALASGLDPVLVHDGARPLVRPDAIAAVAQAAARHGAAILASAVTDTIKDVRDGRIRATVDRSHLFRAETPQGFRRSWLRAGLAAAERDGVEVTDDAGLIERIGRPVRIVPSLSPNPKVTQAGDLALVQALLRTEAVA